MCNECGVIYKYAVDAAHGMSMTTEYRHMRGDVFVGHCLTEPSVSHYHGLKQKKSYEWNRYGETHRIDGPAVILEDYSGNTIEKWFLDGEQFESEEEFLFYRLIRYPDYEE